MDITKNYARGSNAKEYEGFINHITDKPNNKYLTAKNIVQLTDNFARTQNDISKLQRNPVLWEYMKKISIINCIPDEDDINILSRDYNESLDIKEQDNVVEQNNNMIS